MRGRPLGQKVCLEVGQGTGLRADGGAWGKEVGNGAERQAKGQPR